MSWSDAGTPRSSAPVAFGWFCASIKVRAISSRNSGIPSLRFTISSTTRSGSTSELASELIIFSHSRLVMRFNTSVVT